MPSAADAQVIRGQVIGRLGAADVRRAGMVTYADFCPDGVRIAWANQPDQVEIWDIRTGREALLLGGLSEAGMPYAVRWSPNGDRLVLFEFGKPTIVYVVEDDRQLWSATAARSCSWSPDGERLACTGDSDSTVTIRRATDGAPLIVRPVDDVAALNQSRCWWSPDGRWIFLADASRHAFHEIIRADTLEMVVRVRSDMTPWGAAWSPDGAKIAVTGLGKDFGGASAVYDTQTGNLMYDLSKSLGEPHDYAATDVVGPWSPEGRYLMTGWRSRRNQNDGDLLRLHRTDTWDPVAELHGGSGAITATHWNHNRQAVRAVYDNGEIWEWDVSIIGTGR